MSNIHFEKQKGFTMLIAIVTTSILLIVSFAVANVVVKQISAIYAGKQSQVALYSAESGVECAMYWDLKDPSGDSAFDQSKATEANPKPSLIKCYDIIPVRPDTLSQATSTFRIKELKGGGCADVNVGKYTTVTIIESRGYNTCSDSDRRFERALVVTY
jgi:competence protein ComGC